MRITTNNGTTISGSLSEVLATLSHLGVKAEDVKPVTSAEVTETTVTGAAETTGDGYVVSLAPKGSYLPISYDEMAGQLAKLHAGETAMPEATPKLTRDGVIKQAIADVKDLLSRDYYGGGSEEGAVVSHVGDIVDFRLRNNPDRVDFFINADKRVVIAKLHLETTTSTGTAKAGVYATQGRAKCAPGDVFNEHIGKAIALRRALGLAVPVEYFEVEARDFGDSAVGDVVRGNLTGSFYELAKSTDNQKLYCAVKAPGYNSAGKVDFDTPYATTLINDSARHTAPDLEVSRIIRH